MYDPFPGWCPLGNILYLPQPQGFDKKASTPFSQFFTDKGENGRLQRGGVAEVKLDPQNETGRMRPHVG